MPRPISLVEKNGSKIFSITSVAHAGAGVAHLDQHILARRDVALAELARLRLADIGGADDELAAIGHGVARIDGKIDDHLLELVEIGFDRPEVVGLVEL